MKTYKIALITITRTRTVVPHLQYLQAVSGLTEYHKNYLADQ